MQMLSRNPLDALAEAARCADGLSDEQALALAGIHDTAALLRVAAALRDAAHGNVITYSRKVFIPLTHLCRDVCHYCTFAQTPQAPRFALHAARAGARDRARSRAARLQGGAVHAGREARAALSRRARGAGRRWASPPRSTTSRMSPRAVLEETGLLPHLNAGIMDAREIALLRPLAPSMGIMLESASERLCGKGMPHYGSPDKVPAVRLQTMRLAGEARVPFTTGILIGIGETRAERIESLLALRAIHREYGHLQEIIVQNFRAKPGTRMASAPEPDLEELLWTIAVARLILGPAMSIQAPPNLSPGVLPRLVEAGINDWGGVSPRDARLRQSRGAVAAPRAARGGDRERRQVPAGAPDDLSGLRARGRALGRRVAARAPAGRDRCRGLSARRRLADRIVHRAAGARARAAGGQGARRARQRAHRGAAGARRGRRGPGRSRCHGAVRRARRGFRARLRAGRRTEPPPARRARQLRRQPQHQLHQRLLLQVPVLRLLQGQGARSPARHALRSRRRGAHAPRGRGLGARRHRGLPAGRHPSGVHRARPTSISAGW